jgi:phosphoribosyl-AMP cyclohydrolase
MSEPVTFFEALRFDGRGLIPAIIRDDQGGNVLMHVYLNREALERCLDTGVVHYYSLKMRKVWQKGESSGHRQLIRSIRLNCEGNGLLLSVQPLGGACEEGYQSCFFREWRDGNWVAGDEKVFDPELVYPEFTMSH